MRKVFTMKLYITPGNYISNKEWALKVKYYLRELFDFIYILEYAHWGTNKELMDLEHEADQLKTRIGRKKDYGIFAKSLGVVLVLKAIKEKRIKPRFVVFLGTPVSWCNRNNIGIESYLRGLSCPSLIIQNSKDPAIGSQDLKGYLKRCGVKNYCLVEYENNTHDYDNLDEIKGKIKEFIEKF